MHIYTYTHIYKCTCIRTCVYTCRHTHNGIIISHKKEGNNTFAATWIDKEIIILSEISQKDKDI